MDSTPSITIPAKAWQATGPSKVPGIPNDPLARLLTAFKINDVWFHVEAYQVKKKRGGEQVIANDYFQAEWDALCALQNDGGGFITHRIFKRNYVIVATPYLN